MSAPKATEAAVAAVQQALGCEEESWPEGANPWCSVHYDDDGSPQGKLLHWTERGCPVAVAAADAAMTGARYEVTYGVPVTEGPNPIIMTTYDGTARKFDRWVLQTPWTEVPE